MADEGLTDFIEEVTGESHLRVEDDLGDGFVRLRVAEAERRQAKHDIRGTEDAVIEMLRNARDAHAHSIFVACSREGKTRRITMVDDGDGLPTHMRDRIFEARVTSKLDSIHVDTWGVHGRGMALYAIKENARSARVAASVQDGGSSIAIETDLDQLPEKTDQSSMPVFSVSESGTIVVRGPRNINRTVAEFSYINRDLCTVYYGSPVEIAATLWAFGRLSVSDALRSARGDLDQIPVCKRIAYATTPEEFSEIAASMGLFFSSRSARRIMDGEIDALDSLAQNINPYETKRKQETQADPAADEKGIKDAVQQPVKKKKRLLIRDERGLKIAQEDLAAFKKELIAAYADLAEAYFLEEDVTPQIKVRRDSIRITIPVRKRL